MNKTINWKLTRNGDCNRLVHLIASVISSRTGDFAIIGEVLGMMFTCGDSNTIMFKLVEAAARGARIHFYVEQRIANALRQNRMVNRLMNKQSVVIHIVRDWNKFSLGDDMKFKGVVMNPPFCSGLHLKVLKGVIPAVDFEHGGTVACIHPAAWLQFPTRARDPFMNGLIWSFDMMERANANDMFGIDGGDLVVTTLKQNGASFAGDAVEDREFCCFKYNSRFAANWQIVKSIYEKVIAKCPQGTYQNALTKNTISNYPLRMSTARSATMSEHEKGGTTGFRIVSQNYTTAVKIHTAGGISFLNFNSDVERKNAWQSYLTKFARFCVAMDESTKLAPYMGNYQQPWDDQRFYAYFGLTDEEIDVIENTIK